MTTTLSLTGLSRIECRATPCSKFQIMMMLHIPTEHVSITLKGNTVIMSESCMEVLVILIDGRPDFSQYISLIYSNAARQLNALGHNSFVISNFSYCSWKDSKYSKTLAENISKWFHLFIPRYVSNNRNDPSPNFRLRVLTPEVFKSLQKSNPSWLHDLFEIKTDYPMQNPMILIHPKRRTTNYDIRTVSYIGANIWNQLPFIDHDTLHMSASEFKQLLSAWNGPDLNTVIGKYTCPCPWHSS